MTRPPAAAPALLELSTPDEVLEAVPYLLGFHPKRSLVVLGLSGPRSRVGVSMRMDIDAGPPEQLAATVLRALRQDGDEQAILVFYDPAQVDHEAVDRHVAKLADEVRATGPAPDEEGEIDLTTVAQPARDLAAALGRRLEDAGIRVRDALAVDNGRWRSYLCRDPACCPPDGRALATHRRGSSVVDATAVSAGLSALADRDELRRVLEPPAPWSRAASDQAIGRLGETLMPRLAAGETEEVEEEVLARAEEFVHRFGERNPALSDDEVALLAVGLHLLEVRDTVITWGLRDDADALQRLLVEVVRRVGPPDHVPAATVLAWLCYLQGRGGMANIALEPVFAAQPDYPLAQLVDRMVQGGLHPDLLRRTTRETADELRSRRAARRAARRSGGDANRPADAGCAGRAVDEGDEWRQRRRDAAPGRDACGAGESG